MRGMCIWTYLPPIVPLGVSLGPFAFGRIAHLPQSVVPLCYDFLLASLFYSMTLTLFYHSEIFRLRMS